MKKLKYLSLIILSVFIFTGCFTTVAPKTIVASAPSYSGTNTTSGIIKFIYNDKHEVISLILTQERVDRYNALIGKYGYKFLPKLKKNDGITDLHNGTYQMDGESVVKFAEMQQWFKNGVK